MRLRPCLLALLPAAACLSAEEPRPAAPELHFCGDGVIDPGERCDRAEANGTPGAGCTAGRDRDGDGVRDDGCLTGGCGDGLVGEGEQCDPGDATANDDCGADCRFLCGNGVVDPGEECDWADPHEPVDTCEFVCRRAQYCGNGRQDFGELCDASADGAGCTSECTPICGDGLPVGFHLPGGELCDDGPGALAALSSCDPTSCRFARCGDGVLDRTEPCDDGGESVTCTADCTLRAGCAAVDVVAGWWTLLVRLQDGTLLGSGGNNAFALGLPDAQTALRRPTPLAFPRFARVAAGERAGAGLTADGRLFTWGNGEKGQRGLGVEPVDPGPLEVALGVPAVDVAVGFSSTWVVDADGGLWAFGLDDGGALGLDAEAKVALQQACAAGPCVPTPARIGPPGVKFRAVSGYATTAVAVDERGRLWGWGPSDAGSIGPRGATFEAACRRVDGSTLGCEPTPKLLDEALEGVTEAATGAGQTIFLKDGRVFGLGVELQLGLPPNPDGLVHRTEVPVELGAALLQPGEHFERVASGDHWIFAVSSEGRLFGAGGNGHGQLGRGTTSGDELFAEIPVPGAVRAATASWGHSALLLRDGRVLTMGYTDEVAPGRLGREPTPEEPATLAVPGRICP